MRNPRATSTGAHQALLETPHVHHWDSMMVVEESTSSLFPSDLYLQPGDQPPVVEENLGTEMTAFYQGLVVGRPLEAAVVA